MSDEINSLEWLHEVVKVVGDMFPTITEKMPLKMYKVSINTAFKISLKSYEKKEKGNTVLIKPGVGTLIQLLMSGKRQIGQFSGL